MWNLIAVHLEVVLASAQVKSLFATNVARPWKSFCADLMVLLANVGQEETHFDPFGNSFNLGTR